MGLPLPKLIGENIDLLTTDKTSLVNAINENVTKLNATALQWFLLTDIQTDGLTLGNIMLIPNNIILGTITLA